MQDQFRLNKSGATPPHTLDFDFIDRITQARSINENDRQAADARGFFNSVASRAGNGRHDRTIMAKELIEQARFSNVGPPNYGGANTAPKNLTLICRAEEFIDESGALLQ